MPEPLPGLSRFTSSAFPSPFASRSSMSEPPVREPPASAFVANELPITRRSPFGATTMCRGAPTLSANTVAQNPGGSVRLPLSGSQGTALERIRAAPDAATTRTTTTPSETARREVDERIGPGG